MRPVVVDQLRHASAVIERACTGRNRRRTTREITGNSKIEKRGNDDTMTLREISVKKFGDNSRQVALPPQKKIFRVVLEAQFSVTPKRKM